MDSEKWTFELGPIFIEHFAVGDKVFLDSLRSGLVPGVVVGLREPTKYHSPAGEVHVRVTGARYAYRKGEIVKATPNDVVKRTWVRRRRYGTSYVVPPRPTKS